MNTELDISQYQIRNVFWGRSLPRISLFDDNLRLIASWNFSKRDNFIMNIRCIEVLDSKKEMEDGKIRKRVRGYRLYIDFRIKNIENRDLLMFLRKMWTAAHIYIAPHRDAMKNPNDDSYEFEVHIISNFEPIYFNNRFIGHEISFSFESVYLLREIPRDENISKIILATTQRIDGIDSANRQTSMTYFGEKMFYGGWERTQEDLKAVAFWERPENEDEIEPYGQIW
ncbi:MAG TPA: hypothetical protein ENI52_01340 [Thermoplasmata archaeon]|nr:hypothetical protein [Thermoplasmata archaeon]